MIWVAALDLMAAGVLAPISIFYARERELSWAAYAVALMLLCIDGGLKGLGLL